MKKQKLFTLMLTLVLLFSLFSAFSTGALATGGVDINIDTTENTPAPEATASAEADPAETEAPEATEAPAATQAVDPYPTTVGNMTLIKSPGSDPATPEGGRLLFYAAASNYTKVEWQIISEDGKHVFTGKDEIEAAFRGVTVLSYAVDMSAYTVYEVLDLRSIPVSLHGWYVGVNFYGADNSGAELKLTTNYKNCKITIQGATVVTTPEPTEAPVAEAEETPAPDAAEAEPEVTSTPEPTATPEPTPEPTAVPTPEPTETPAPTAAPTPTAVPVQPQSAVLGAISTPVLVGVIAVAAIVAGLATFAILRRMR